MPVHLSERDGKYCVTEPNGTVKKCYDSREAALRYLRAINMHLKKSKGFEELEQEAEAAHAPAIQIVSDGTAEGTLLLVNGVEVPFTGLDFYCNNDGDYQSCSMNIRTREQGPNGLTVERSFNLRQTPPPADVKAAGALDPQAKVRNRGDAVFPANSKKVKDNKDHFPINNADQARNALSRVAQYSTVPSWYAGSLSELQSAVRSAVSRKFPGIKVTK